MKIHIKKVYPIILLGLFILFLFLVILIYDNIFYQFIDLPDGSLLKVSKITKTIYVKPYFMNRCVFSIDKNRIVYLILDDFEPTPINDQSIPLFIRLQYNRIAPLIWNKIHY